MTGSDRPAEPTPATRAGSGRSGPQSAGTGARASGTGARVAGIVGGAVGAIAAAVAAGVAVERYAIGRIRAAPDTERGQPFGGLRPDRAYTATTDDGIDLRVCEDGPPDADLTVLFAHGYCLASGSWHYQWRGLGGRPGRRLVFFDQRSHGRSGSAPIGSASIERLGTDLGVVLDAAAPRGPVVLVGHSMGGMALMSLAGQRPELFGTRVVACALICTSSGRLSEVPLGMPSILTKVRGPLVPLMGRGARLPAGLMERGRWLTGDLAYLLTRRYGFGSTRVSPSLVEYAAAMIAATPVDVILDYLPAITRHDGLGTLSALRAVDTLVVAGDRDMLTPLEHSTTIAQALPNAELLVVEGAGHLAMLERPALVNDRLDALITRAANR